ncbi:sensor histidine kinase [Maricaulis sp. D1M11]|uniref:sensor histidine kinase n=1 Tax=Maricaulis sp. D1M11 TaxID=3076117 RepID=UPI0039B36C20
MADAPYRNFFGLGVTTVLQLAVMLLCAHLLGRSGPGRLSGFLALQIPLVLAAFLIEGVDTVQFYERFNVPYNRLAWSSFLGHGLRLYMVFLVWSSLLCVVMALVLLERQKRQLAEAQTLARSAELAALRYQLQPHFLFNTLSTLHALIDEGQGDAARSMVETLAHVLRRVLSDADRDFAPVNQEIAFLQDYLFLEHHRFGERLQVEFEISPELESLDVPRLLLQPLVENAIKHGRPRDGEPLRIRIWAHSEADRAILTVTDNGPGLGEASASGVGVRNVADRLERVYGKAASFALRDADPSGVCARIELPLQRPEIGR